MRLLEKLLVKIKKINWGDVFIYGTLTVSIVAGISFWLFIFFVLGGINLFLGAFFGAIWIVGEYLFLAICLMVLLFGLYLLCLKPLIFKIDSVTGMKRLLLHLKRK